MALWGGLDLDAAGNLTIAGHHVVTLARSFGTPLLVLNEEEIRGQARRYRAALAATGYPSWQVVYAAKAFLAMALCELLAEEDIGLDVVSGGELYMAQAAGFPAAHIIFHGNNKSRAELEQAVLAQVGRIVVDNFHELELLREVAGRAQGPVPVLLRVAPGVEAETHSYIQTGTQDTKFGFDLASGQALEAARQAAASPGLDFRGFHAHIGSQLFSVDPFLETVSRLMALAGETTRTTGRPMTELDLGGGLGIRYLEGDEPPAVEEMVAALVERVRREAEARNLPLPHLILEPGRSLIGEAGTTVYTVGSIKRVPGLPAFVAVDGGMSDNPRPALYDAQYTALLVPTGGGEAPRPLEDCRIVGKLCESGDVLVKHCRLPSPQPGDLVVLLSTGAYTYSMASHYNLLPRPAVVLVNKERARVIIRREEYRDLLRGHQPLTAEAAVLQRRPAP
ncbi:MAG TPA: diaminopimelate decarboxylase [Sphingobacteriaceae bacterium]|nr:diaminopimelate decarboxylase [Sphingobacteriaceae bacterium]